MKQSEASIKKSVKALRKIVDTSKDPATVRMAYYAECALRWAIGDTVGWPRPEIELQLEVTCLKDELG